MTLRWADRICDTSTSTGVGNITVSGTPPTGFRAFNLIPSIVTNDTFYLTITDQAVTVNWEVSLATWLGANVIQRTTVLASSNNNAAVNFTSGALICWLDWPASFIASISVQGSSPGFANVTVKNSNYTFAATDIGDLLRHTDTSTYTWTIDTFANTGITAGNAITGTCESTGTLTIVPPTGGTLVRLDGVVNTAGNRTIGGYSQFTIENLDGANAWGITGSAIS